jgi:transcriptional regulator CtsR
MAVSTPSSKTEALKSLIDDIFAQRRISRQVQHELMQILLSQPNLTSQDQAMANRVFEAIQQGRLRIVD